MYHFAEEPYTITLAVGTGGVPKTDLNGQRPKQITNALVYCAVLPYLPSTRPFLTFNSKPAKKQKCSKIKTRKQRNAYKPKILTTLETNNFGATQLRWTRSKQPTSYIFGSASPATAVTSGSSPFPPWSAPTLSTRSLISFWLDFSLLILAIYLLIWLCIFCFLKRLSFI